MTTKTDTPLIFISYSWKPLTNKKRTLELAERLSTNGVHVIIDEWDLAEGQDKYQFMEQMVTNPDIRRVLLICNKEYTEKANQKKGGVGAESLIISDKIYKQADQKKFIPIIIERDENGNEYVPTFIKTRIYIDFSSDDIFEEQYEKLLRNIFDKPASKRPPIGTAPSYITDKDPIYLPTAHKVKAIKTAFVNERANAWVFVDDYFDNFLSALKEFEITYEELGKTKFIDDEILKRIDQMIFLRDDFIEFLNVVLKYAPSIDTERFHRFFEKLIEFIMSDDGWNHPSNNFGYLKLDQYRFFYYELFLHITAIFIHFEKYTELGYILNNSFILYNNRNQKTEPYGFMIFNQPVRSLNEHRNKRLNLRRVNFCADLIKQRSKSDNLINFDRLKEMDTLLYFISIMQNESELQLHRIRWFPHLAVYRTYQVPILQKLTSKRYFEKIKPLFDIQDEVGLKQKVKKVIEKKADKFEKWHYEVPYIQQAFDLENIGKIK